MKLSRITIFTAIFLSTNALSEVVYYHCEKAIDSYWMFDIEAISNKEITPHIKPKVRMRQMSEVIEFGNVEMTDEWFKVIRGIDQTSFFNRQGKESFFRANDIFFGISNIDMECRIVNKIDGENLNIFFLTRSELNKRKGNLKTKGFNNLPEVKNWN